MYPHSCASYLTIDEYVYSSKYSNDIESSVNPDKTAPSGGLSHYLW